MTIEIVTEERISSPMDSRLCGLRARGFVERTADAICNRLNCLIVSFEDQPVIWSAGETTLEEELPFGKRTYNERVPVSMQLRQLYVAPQKHDVKLNGSAHALVWGCATRRVVNNERLRPHLKAELVTMRLERDRDLTNVDLIASQCSRLKRTTLIALRNSVHGQFKEFNFVHVDPPEVKVPTERDSRFQQMCPELAREIDAILEHAFISRGAGYQPKASDEIAQAIERSLGTREFRGFLL